MKLGIFFTSNVIFSSFEWFTSFVYSLVWSTSWSASCSSFSSFVQYFRMRNERPANESEPEYFMNYERQWTMNYDVGWRMCTRIYIIYGLSRITNTNKRTNVLRWQITYYIPKISKRKDVNVLILAPLHTALTAQVYWSNQRNELDKVDEQNEVDELDEVNEVDVVDEVESSRTVPEWSTVKWGLLVCGR